MILVVDSGATKADWQVVQKGQLGDLYTTMGFSPFYHTSEFIAEQLAASELTKLPLQEVTHVHYYGTGIHNTERADIVRAGLQPMFPMAVINVVHDLLAAARATCGRKPGVACILGTGSNSCYYDGQQIIDNVPSLGFLLGDEASGAHLGKALLKSYFYRELAPELKLAFDKMYPEGGTAIKDRVYAGNANVYVASFTYFLYEHRQHPQIRRIVLNCFDEFVRRQVAKYQKAREVRIHFVGSIAWHFQDILRESLTNYGLKMGEVVRKPILELARYHMSETVSN